MNDKSHLYYFDWLRIVAMFGVIAIHSVGAVSGMRIGVEWGFVNLVLSFVYTSVPLFLMMSGYLTLTDERTGDIPNLLKKRIPRILVPLIGWTVISILINCLLSHNLNFDGVIDGIVASLASPAWPHLWYLYTLIAILLISPILCGGLNSLSKSGHIMVLVIIGVVSLRKICVVIAPKFIDPWFNVDIINKMEFFEGYLCTFILGYYLGTMKKRIPNWILVTVFFVTLGVIAGGSYWRYWRTGVYTAEFCVQSSGFEIILASSVFLIFKQNVRNPSKILKKFPVVPLSFGIYLCHDIVLAFVRVLIKTPSFLGSLLWIVITFTVSWFIIKTAASIKPICYIVTGMSYQQACNSCNWIYTFRKIKSVIKK